MACLVMLNRLWGLSKVARVAPLQDFGNRTTLVCRLIMSEVTESPKLADSPNIAHEPCESPKQKVTADEETVQIDTTSDDNPKPLSKRAQKRVRINFNRIRQLLVFLF